MASKTTHQPMSDTEEIDIESIAKDSINTKPDVNVEAIKNASKEPSEPKSESKSEPVDRKGNVFDPSIHKKNEDGSPKLTARGTWAQRFRKSAKKAVKATSDGIKSFVGKPPTDVPDSEMKEPQSESMSGEKTFSEEELAARQLVGMEQLIAMSVFGDEWVFLAEEQQALVMSWVRAFEETGIVKVPWWMELAAAHAMIIGSRLSRPKTQGKLSRWLDKFKAWKLNRRANKSKGKDKEEEQSA